MQENSSLLLLNIWNMTCTFPWKAKNYSLLDITAKGVRDVASVATYVTLHTTQKPKRKKYYLREFELTLSNSSNSCFKSEWAYFPKCQTIPLKPAFKVMVQCWKVSDLYLQVIPNSCVPIFTYWISATSIWHTLVVTGKERRGCLCFLWTTMWRGALLCPVANRTDRVLASRVSQPGVRAQRAVTWAGERCWKLWKGR